MAEITHQVVTNTGGLIIRTPLSMWITVVCLNLKYVLML